MKKLFFLFMIGASLFLASCQSSKEGENMNENESTKQTSNSSIEKLPIKDTEFGRGAGSDGKDTNANEEPTRILTKDSKEIIIYFSRSGNSENLARMIHDTTNADVLELSIENPYPADYDETVERANQERENQNYPKISTKVPDFSQYDYIYLGYQTWAMTLSNPITSFLMDHGSEFSRKTIYPFSTNAGYGEGDTLERITELAPESKVAKSFNIEDKDLLNNQVKLTNWLNQNK